MKILIPAIHYPPVIGGFEVFSQNMAERIGKTDDVFVVTSRVIGTPNYEAKNKLRIFRISPQALKDLSCSGSKFVLGSMIWIFFKSLILIKKEKIELVHAQGFLSGILSYIIKKITKIPYIITIQSADFSVYHRNLNFKPIVHFYGKLEKTIFKNAIFCHAISKHLEKHFHKYGIQKTIVIPNGADIEKFRPDLNKTITRKKLGFDTKNLIICVSRLEHKNGTHDLIAAANYLKQQINDFKIVICGSGSQKEQLEKMIEEFELGDRIFLLGSILYSKIPQYVAAADIFIRPSLAEGFGNVFIEAMATGIAVIGTPVGGIVDFIRNRETGLFCEPENPKDIAEKIKLLIDDKELRRKISENGKKMVEEVYSWDIIADSIKKLYYRIKDNN